MADDRTARVHLTLPPISTARIRGLREKTDARTCADVMRHALRLYEALVAEVENGSKVIVRDGIGRETHVSL